MLKQRIVSACIMAAGFIAALFFLPVFLFKLFIAIVLAVAAWEWGNLAGFTHQAARVAYAVFISALALGGGFFAQGYQIDASLDQAVVKSILLSGCFWWAIALLWVQGYPSSALLWGSRWVRLLMGIFVLVPTWTAMAYLREQVDGAWVIVIVVAIVVIADIGAYFSGKAFGRRKLALQVSPGKSWEGFWGGLAGCVCFALLLSWVSGAIWWQMLAMIIPASLASVLGDLLESMVKRERGIKDSSQLLPGHGGVMDRVDSLTACAPVFALAVLASGWTLAG